MSELSSMIPSAGEATGSRFSLVSYVPTYATALVLVLLIMADVPAGPLNFDSALGTLEDLTAIQVVLFGVFVLFLAVLLHPLQLPLVRLMEGYWPRALDRLSKAAVRNQERARLRLARLTEVSPAPPADSAERALVAGWELSRRFPPPGTALLPTTLGNALRAAESTAGAAYGADAVAWWPRLYPVLGESTKAIVDDRRTQLDLACRLTAMTFIVGTACVVLLGDEGWWLALAAVPLIVMRVAYRAAVSAAVAYGEAVRAAFDLHRFDALAALHLPLPDDPVAEASLNRQLSMFWVQDVPMQDLRYVHQGPRKGQGSEDEKG
jgi:hypothetical protein